MATGIELATAYVSLGVSTKGIGQQVSREFAGIERDADKHGKRIGGRLSAGIGGSLKGLAGIGAVLGVTDFVGDAIGEARESQKVGAISTQIIKATGGAAKVTSKQVGDLSTSISNKTGVDDEAIQTGANMLLTFKNVRNETGKGAKIFDRATQAAADLSAAGFGDMSATSKQLGKALNDPLKGIAALGKSGVTFTDQQKEQIKTLVKSGDTLGAQQIILKEVESQVGGTAEASATAGEKLATSFGNFKEGIGTALLPILDTIFTKASGFLGFLTENLGPALGEVGDFFEPVVTGFEAFFAALEEGDVTSDGFVGFMETIGDFLHRNLPPAIQLAKDTFAAIVGFIRDEVVPRFLSIAKAVGDFIAVALPLIQDFVVKKVIPAFLAMRDFIVNEVLPRLMAIADTVKKFVDVALPIVIEFVKGMIARIEPLMPTIRTIFGTIGQIITGALDLIKAIIERVTAVIAWVWSNWGQGIMDTIAFVWDKVLKVIEPAFGTIRDLFAVFTKVFKGDWSGAWESLKGVFSGAWKTVTAAIDGAVGLLARGLETAWKAIVSVAGTVWEGLTGAMSGPIDRAMQFIQENLIDKINGLFAFLQIPVKIEPIWKQSNVGSGQAKAGRLGTSRKLGKAAFASGGVLPGWSPGRDIHEFFSPTGGRLALSGGEGILIPQATRGLGGRAGIAAINDFFRKGQSFASGGVFESVGNAASGAWSAVTDPLGALRNLISSVLGQVGSNPMARLASGLVGKAMGFLIEKVKGLFGGGNIPAVGVNVNGQRLDADTLRRITAAGGFRVIQGSKSFNPLSQGTHAGWGAADLVTRDWMGGVARLRAQGMLAMFRNWPGNQHIHALNPNVQGLSPQALAQVRRARANNGNFKDGGVLKPFVADSGVTLAPGINVLNNKLGKPEPLARTDVASARMHIDDLAEMKRALFEGSRAGTAAGFGAQVREAAYGARD